MLACMTSEPPTDPRIPALLDLVQALIGRYGELASSLAEHLPAEVKAELVDHVQTVTREARDRVAEVALMAPAPPVDTYRLSSRPGVVGGPS